MKIEILGTGRKRCRKTEERIRDALEKTGVEAEIVRVSTPIEIVARGVVMTPAVIIDGVKKIEGRVPAKAWIKTWITE